jgi:5-methylcytosine-specific restriction endonuclease McrA
MREGDEINHLDIFERDNWMCGICGYWIDPQYRFPDHRAATVDHIVPLSCGGTHTFENCQAAHRRCNEAKADGLTSPVR